MQYQLGALATCAAIFVYAILRRRRRLSTIRDVQGPVNSSWIFGHQWYLLNEEVGGPEKRFLEDFGNVVRWKGPLGEDRLWIADPKAVNHILQKAGYSYARARGVRERTAMVTGHGIAWAEGDVHKRHKRVMAPAFGPVEMRGLLPYFMDVITKMVDKWDVIIENSKSGNSAIIDVNMWFGKATLDAIGTAAFGYDFGALDDADNPYTKSYTNLVFGAFANPSQLFLFFSTIMARFPGFITWLRDNSSAPGMKKLRWNMHLGLIVGRELLDSKRQESKAGTPRKDVMSLLVKSSDSQRQDWRLSDEEIIPQVQTIMFAGQETTSKALTLGFWELAKHRDCQEKLRAEINETLTKVKARGDTDFTASDFESMPYLVAVTKEILRVHPITPEIQRAPMEDDVLPLTKPIVGISGRVHTELLIPKGTIVAVSQLGYNLNHDLWGPDAQVFRPERWFEMNEQVESPVGLYGNLSTFGGGVRSCIGWRFTVIEIQAFLVTLVRKFDISVADHHPQIKRVKLGLMAPVVLGEEYKGTQLPLKITAIRDT